MQIHTTIGTERRTSRESVLWTISWLEQSRGLHHSLTTPGARFVQRKAKAPHLTTIECAGPKLMMKKQEATPSRVCWHHCHLVIQMLLPLASRHICHTQDWGGTRSNQWFSRKCCHPVNFFSSLFLSFSSFTLSGENMPFSYKKHFFFCRVCIETKNLSRQKRRHWNIKGWKVVLTMAQVATNLDSFTRKAY